MPDLVGTSVRQAWINDLAQLPANVGQAVAGLTEAQLDTPYRPGGWTVRQVAHHLADSHMNAFVRLKLALTEDWPTIKPYHEDRWAEGADNRRLPIGPSLALLEHLHHRWAYLLGTLAEGDFARGFVHPAQQRRIRLDEQLGSYAWHGLHHTAHVTALRVRLGW
jgi:hypothetical protein